MTYCTKCGKPTNNGIMCEDCIILGSPWLLSMKSKEDDLVEQNEKLKSENAALRDRLKRAGGLPCKVGDTIYQTDTNGTRIFKNTVKNIIFETDGVAFDERAIGEWTIGAASRAAEIHADDEIKLTREDVENAEEIDLTGAEERPLTDEEMLNRFARRFPSSIGAIVWNIKCARMAREKYDDNDDGKSV